MTGVAWQAQVQDTTGHWSTSAIHDTVAVIARQPAYSTSIRQSLLGRLFRFLFDRLRDLRGVLHNSLGARLTVILAVALIVIVIVARIVVARRLDEQRARVRGARGLGGGARTDYWSMARELERAGDHAAACHTLYAAVLDALARGGAVRFHPSKTSGDYARELTRRGAPVAAPFATFARHFEHVVFGTDVVTSDDFERLSAAAEHVTPTRAAA